MPNHCAGIIPVNSQPMDFSFHWHDCLMPIAPNYYAIQRSVVECAFMGCDTIWIVCPKGITPLLRHIVGEYIQDPVHLFNRYAEMKGAYNKEIPIYYVPISPKDKDKRDSIVYNLLYGCIQAKWVASRMSKWIIPQKYFISFPNAVYPYQWSFRRRKNIIDKEKLIISHQGKTIRDGLMLGTTINNENVDFLLNKFKEKATSGMDTELYKTQKKIKLLPMEQRYSGRFLTLKDIFKDLPEDDDNTFKMEVSWYYPLDTWERYGVYLSSDEVKKIKPKRKLLHYKEAYGVGSSKDIK